jgi:hypothetical protein
VYAKVCFAILTLTTFAAPAFAAPSFLAKPRPYNASSGGIQWEVFVTLNDAAYTGTVSVELPLTLTQVSGAPGSPATTFPQFLNGAGGDDTNGASTATWYYNETAAGSGNLLWNISDPPDPNNHTQISGDNPFTGAMTEGLWIDPDNRRLFAALGSADVLPDALPAKPGKQVRLLRVLSSDGILNWPNASIIENGVEYGDSSKSLSIIPGDLNASGDMNPATGAFQDAVTNADITDFRRLLDPFFGVQWYNDTHPGLNGAKRGDCNGSGTTTNADITCFRQLLQPIDPLLSAAGVSFERGAAVPEPASVVLLLVAVAIVCAWRSRPSWTLVG